MNDFRSNNWRIIDGYRYNNWVSIPSMQTWLWSHNSKKVDSSWIYLMLVFQWITNVQDFFKNGLEARIFTTSSQDKKDLNISIIIINTCCKHRIYNKYSRTFRKFVRQPGKWNKISKMPLMRALSDKETNNLKVRKTLDFAVWNPYLFKYTVGWSVSSSLLIP